VERHFVSVLGFVGGYGRNLMFMRDAVTIKALKTNLQDAEWGLRGTLAITPVDGRPCGIGRVCGRFNSETDRFAPGGFPPSLRFATAPRSHRAK
jgi:hypothetical protein